MTSANDAELLRLNASQALRLVSSTPGALEVESTWEGNGPPPQRHFHPRQEELFVVLEGELTVELEREVRAIRAGESIAVPQGTVHRMWNAGSDPVRATWRITPRLGTEDLFRFIDAGLSPARTGILLWRFRREFRVPTPLHRRPARDG